MTAKSILAAFLALLTAAWGQVSACFHDLVNDYAFTADISETGGVLPNVKSNVNVYGGRFPEDPERNATDDPFDFIEYVQLMECSGGNADRDLFADPDDFTTTGDIDLSDLISSCRGILRTGAKPVLKLGNVPRKLSQQNAAKPSGEFDVNVYPPDDYDAYYRYIKAIAEGLIAEFGRDEILTWRWGVLTEFENASWFMAPDGAPVSSMQAYCKLYDYTVQALIDTIGPDVFVGAHAMGVSEGLWDERDFIRHCGTGRNWYTGKKGTRLCYMATSYYEHTPGNTGDTQKPLPQIINEYRETAESVGLNDLIYGVDEGRVLAGLRSGATSDALFSRTVGYTWQAAYDARLVKQMFDCGADYFSSWSYLSRGLTLTGLPVITYHLAKHAAEFEGMNRVGLKRCLRGLGYKVEVDGAAAYDEQSGRFMAMLYNFKNDLDYTGSADIKLRVKSSGLPDGDAPVTVYYINDDCNWFDEWQTDRQAAGITDDHYSWSPDDGNLSLARQEGWDLYYANLDKYTECAKLTPVEETAAVKDGVVTVDLTLDGNSVAFVVF